MKSFLLYFSLLFTISFSWAYGSGSAFAPPLTNEVQSSFLLQSEQYDDVPDVPAGMHSPLSEWGELRSGISEAFALGKAKNSLFRYGYVNPSITFEADFNFVAGYDYSKHDDHSYGLLYKGTRFNAKINEKLRLRSLWYNGAFFGDSYASLNTSPLVDGFYKDSRDKIWIDNQKTDLTYRDEHLLLSLGRDNFQIGNSISGSVILDKNVNEYGYLLAEAFIGAFRISLLHASLSADTTVSIYNDNSLANNRHYPDKFLALHQISYLWDDVLELSFGEGVIYGSRGIDINYLVPHSFWRVNEHNLHDRDNVLIFGSINLYRHEEVTLYANAIIDEMRYADILGNWWGNKYAFQSGISYHAKGRTLLPKIGFEFSAVRPWLYTHYLPYSYYSHDKRTLGYPKGTNLIDFSAQAAFPLPHASSLAIYTSYTRQGSEANHYYINYLEEIDDIENHQCKWLSGKISKIYQIKTIVRNEVFAHHRFMLGFDSKYNEDWQHSLFANWQFLY